MTLLTTVQAALMRALLALALAASLAVPHRAAGGEMMVICGADGVYSVPLDDGGTEAPAHDAACCLILCAAALPASGAAIPEPGPAIAAGLPSRGVSVRAARGGAHGARGPPASV